MIRVLRSGDWLTADRVRAAATVSLALSGLSILWLLVTSHGTLDAWGRPLGTDFSNVWTAGQMALDGRPDVGEIGAERPAPSVERAVRRRQQVEERQAGKHKRDGRDRADAVSGEPVAAAQVPKHRRPDDAGGDKEALSMRRRVRPTRHPHLPKGGARR